MPFYWNGTKVQWYYNDNMTFLIVFNKKSKILLAYKIESVSICMAFWPVIQERFLKCEILNRLYC